MVGRWRCIDGGDGGDGGWIVVLLGWWGLWYPYFPPSHALGHAREHDEAEDEVFDVLYESGLEVYFFDGVVGGGCGVWIGSVLLYAYSCYSADVLFFELSYCECDGE